MTVTETRPTPAFWSEGACHDVPADWFHPERGESTTDAKTVCATCPVRVPCLTWALDNHEKFGIWGGTSERERRRIKRRMGAGQAIPELTPDWAPRIRRAAPTAPVPAPEEERPVGLTIATPATTPATNGDQPEPRTDACVNCGTRYTPARRDQRFHSKECARAWYASHPKGESGKREPRIGKQRAVRAPVKVRAAVKVGAAAAPVPKSIPVTGAVTGPGNLQDLLGHLLAGCDRWTVEADLGDVHIIVSRGRP